MNVSRVGDFQCVVGEGPVWDVEEQALYFVDMRSRRVWRHEPETMRFESWEMPAHTSIASVAEDGRILVTLDHGFYALDRNTAALEPVLIPDLPEGTQFNDGKADRQGRLVAGTTDKKMASPIAELYRLEGERLVVLDSGYTLSNGPCFSPDGRLLYCCDSVAEVIHVYDYDGETGLVSGRRLFADVSTIGGLADGATVDETGHLWLAICGGGKVVRFNPAGQIVAEIPIPTPGASSVMFGGPKLDRLYVTTLDPSLFGKPSNSLAGALFVIDDLGVRGLPERRVHLL